MNQPPFDTIGDEPVEARIVAWVLGESSAFEAAELERLCEERPELLVFRRRMRTLHGLLTEAEAAEPDHSWKLPPEKRKLLDEICGEETVVRLDARKELRVRRHGRRAMLAIAACVAITFFITRLMPWKHQAEAIIEVKPRSIGMSPLGGSSGGATSSNPFTPQFFGTEFEKIKSRSSLEKVVENLELPQRWNIDKESALKRVKDSIETRNLDGTDLISIKVRDASEQDAREITREVVSAYKQYRGAIEQREADKSLAELNKAVRDQEDKVEERRKVLATIVRTKGIIYNGPDSFYGQSGVDEDQGARSALQTFNVLAKEQAQLQAQLQALNESNADNQTKATVQAQLAMAKDRLKNVEVMKDDTREEAIKRGLDAQDYVDAKREFETDQQLLQSMKLKQIDESIAKNMRGDSIVVHEMPPPAESEKVVAFSATPAASGRKAEVAQQAKRLQGGIDIVGGSRFHLDLKVSDEATKMKSLPVIRGMIRDQMEKIEERLDSLATNPKSEPQSTTPPSAPPLPQAAPAPSEMPVLGAVDGEFPQRDSGRSGGLGGGSGGSMAFGRSAAEDSKAAVAKPRVVPPPGEPQPMAASAPTDEDTDSRRDVRDSFASRSEFSESAPVALGDEFSQVEGGKVSGLKDSPVAPPPVLLSKASAENKPLPAEPIGKSKANEGPGAMTLNGGNTYTGTSSASAGTLAVDSASLDFRAGLTNGLRSGDQTINRNNIDAILNNPDRVLVEAGKAAGIAVESDAKPPVLAANASTVDPSPKTREGEIVYSDPDTEKAADAPDALRQREIDSLDDAIRNNSALTDEHAQSVDQVRRNLYTAEGNYNLGKYDDAKKAYNDTLKIDPYNSAARRGLEQVEAAKSDYYRAAYDHTRAELLGQVDAAWELKVPADGKKQEFEGTVNYGAPIAAADTFTEGTEHEIHTSYSSEYRFKGKDLSAQEGRKSIPADLAELMEEIPAAENPYSTFSLNISDASFQLAKAALAKGERPDPESIKPEQFYNAVDYGDPAPSSNEPVAATIEQSAHPVIPGRNLVRVALRTGSAGRSAAQPLRLTLLVDQSGSMVREDRRASMEHALAQLGVLLTKADLVTVIGFSRVPHLLAEAKTGDEAGTLGELINQTASEGGTNLEEAMKLGADKALKHQLAGAQNRIVLFTDGAANLGDANPERLAEQVKALRQKGIAFDIAGIGADGLNDRLLSELARNGNGRYYVVGSENNDSFARQLAGAFRPAAENVKVQVNFNPQRVGKYKLIGFEKDRLNTEDFRNDAVDAAELAAEEAGVAIYQVEPLAEGTGELGEVSVRFRDAASGQMVERAWTIPYAAQATAFDRATPSMQLAGLSLLAAEKLKGGPLADAIDFKQLTGISAVVKQFYTSSPRVGDMLQVIEKLK